MLLVEKLASKVAKQLRSRSCAVYLAVYDARTHKNIKALRDANILHSRGFVDVPDALVPLAKENYHVQFRLSEACFASFPSLGGIQKPLMAGTCTTATVQTIEAAAKKLRYKLPGRRKEFNLILEQKKPKYMVYFVTNQFINAVFQQVSRHHDGRVNFDKTINNWPNFIEFEEAYNHLLKLPYMSSVLVGPKNLRWHMENGAVMKTSDMTIQQAFVTGMTLRYPLEHAGIYTGVYKHLKEYGFKPEISAVLALMFTRTELDMHRATGCCGMGHDFVNTAYATDEMWEAILKGGYSPKWTQEPTVGWTTLFYGFNAITHNEGVSEERASKNYHTKIGDGWGARVYINLKKLKEFYDANNAA